MYMDGEKLRRLGTRSRSRWGGCIVPEHQPVGNIRLFVMYAGDELTKWQELRGQRVVHRLHGRGTIIDIMPSEQGKPILKVRYEADTGDNYYQLNRFCDEAWFTYVSLPVGHPGIDRVKAALPAGELEQIEAEIRRAQEMEAAAQLAARKAKASAEILRQKGLLLREETLAAIEFANLKGKYGCTQHKDQSPASPLFLILKQIDSGESLDEEQKDWLKKHRFFLALACYFEKGVERVGDPWAAVNACSNYRKAGQPERGLEVTCAFAVGPSSAGSAMSAILTTRGGAFRDVGDLAQAEQCGLGAIRLEKDNSRQHADYRPYNLLGAICFQRGDGEKGLKYFDKAHELGAPPFEIERLKQESVERAASPEERRAVAEKLLERDPVQYKWAEKYL